MSRQTVRTMRAAVGLLAALLTASCAAGVSPAGNVGSALPLHSQSGSASTLLYVVDSGADKVDVFSYPDGTLLQTLTGFQTPLHACSDLSGNVFVTNAAGAQITEYAHGGYAPIATLLDRGQVPVDCSVDPVTGDLAVTNYGQRGTHAGSVSVYAASKGKPKKRRAAGVIAYLFCTYDGRGDLFVTGLDYKYNLVFLELPKGKSAFVQVALKQRMSGWGGVQWDGKDVTIGDGAATVYRFSVNGRVAKRVGMVHLDGAVNVAAYWLSGGYLIGPDGPNGGNHDVGIWRYPHGGNAVTTLQGNFENPSGATLSTAGSR